MTRYNNSWTCIIGLPKGKFKFESIKYIKRGTTTMKLELLGKLLFNQFDNIIKLYCIILIKNKIKKTDPIIPISANISKKSL